MKKILFLFALLTSSCSFVDEITLFRPTEITMEHLEPITLCANDATFNYDQPGNDLSNLVEMWFNQVITLDKKCNNKIDFNLEDAIMKKSKHDKSIQYEHRIYANLVLNTINSNESRASANVYNKMKFNSKSTLAEKETYSLKLNEKTMADFDKTMRNSIKKYLK